MLRCLDKEILKKFNDDGLSSFTTEEQVCLFINRKINKQTKLTNWMHFQKKVEENVEKCYNFARSNYELDNE